MPNVFTRHHRGGSGPPMVLLHGFTDTWRSWELVLPLLERHHDVLAPTLAGHAGGPPISSDPTGAELADAVEQAMDEAGFATAHVVGNSLGGYLALLLAERGRAESVVALAPGGGWGADGAAYRESLALFRSMQRELPIAAPLAPAIMATRFGRRLATRLIAERFEHIPKELIVHMIHGARACPSTRPLMRSGTLDHWTLEPSLIDCPVRIVWGIEDRVLRWPAAAVRYREEWLPGADWIELEGVGHCPQVDVPQQTADLIVDFTIAEPATMPPARSTAR